MSEARERVRPAAVQSRDEQIKRYVERFEGCIRELEAAQDDIKELAEEAKGEEFTNSEIAAMKRVARVLAKDAAESEREKLAALSKVANAVQLTLF